MAKKTDEAKPGYDATGYRGTATMVKMTYRIAGLLDSEARERAADHLWATMKKGTEAQRDQIGPRIEGNDVVYSFLTFYHGAESEGGRTAEIQTAIAKAVNKPAKMIAVVMSHEPAPPLPEPVEGIDAPPSLSAPGK